MLAAANGHEDVCELLIQNKADLNLVDKDKWSALFYAVDRNHIKSVQTLVNNDINVNLQSQVCCHNPSSIYSYIIIQIFILVDGSNCIDHCMRKKLYKMRELYFFACRLRCKYTQRERTVSAAKCCG